MIVAIVYGTVSKIPRRICVFDNIAEANDPAHKGVGESLIIANVVDLNPPTIRAAIAQHHGISASSIGSGRAVVLDVANKVVKVLMADPNIDTHPDGTIISHDHADLNWVIVGGLVTFKPPAVITKNPDGTPITPAVLP